MQLHDLRPTEGATQKRKRVGRGTGSGKGKTSTRGTKGQRARTGVGIRENFEGGQLPLTKRLPKLRGFNNRFKIEFEIVNLDTLSETFESGAQVSPETLHERNLIESVAKPYVILARGEISKPLNIKANRTSAAAKAKIEAAGGSVEILPYVIDRNRPRS